MKSKKGSCYCGAVHYEITQEPQAMGLCYCRSCQKATGASCLNFLWLPVNAVSLQGDLAWVEGKGGSGQLVKRGFCPKCGTLITGKPEVLEGMCSISAGTLDDIAYFKPTVAIWTQDKPDWVNIDPELHQFEQNPS